jgi:ribosomal protein L11 methyltransferase
MAATWTAVTVTTDPELADAVGSFLLDAGAPGLQSEESADGVRITAHFAGAAPLVGLETFCDALRATFPSRARPSVAVETITDTGWADNWKAHFPPLAIGEQLFVHPPWIDAIPVARIPIVLDPGMAFGTGHHASTRGCLVLLERALREWPGSRVLDLGTGSGILAIAAAKLGACEVWAVDVDRDACAIAADNFAANGVAGSICIESDLDAVPGTFEVVLANLFAAQLVSFAIPIARRLRRGGVAIGAGMLAAEAGEVRAAWRAAGMRDADEHAEDGWVAIAAKRAA